MRLVNKVKLNNIIETNDMIKDIDKDINGITIKLDIYNGKNIEQLIDYVKIIVEEMFNRYINEQYYYGIDKWFNETNYEKKNETKIIESIYRIVNRFKEHSANRARLYEPLNNYYIEFIY